MRLQESSPAARTGRAFSPPRAARAKAPGVGVLLLAALGLGATAPGGGAAPRVAGPKAGTAAPAATAEAQPRKVDAETAVSPVYPVLSKNCRNFDEYGTEGEDYLRKCKGYGGYVLRAAASADDYRTTYGIELPDADAFSVMLFPLEDGPAAKYERADLFDEKLADTIEWRLDGRGKPYAAIVRVAFYKNIGSARTFQRPKNRVAEFVFVRGLKGHEDLKVDVPTVDTPFNPVEQARMIAQRHLDKARP